MHRSLQALGGEDSEFDFLFERHCTERFALVAAEYVESSKTLQIVDLSAAVTVSHEVCEMISLVLRALSVAAQHRHFCRQIR
jgi:hypothetical protein